MDQLTPPREQNLICQPGFDYPTLSRLLCLPDPEFICSSILKFLYDPNPNSTCFYFVFLDRKPSGATLLTWLTHGSHCFFSQPPTQQHASPPSREHVGGANSGERRRCKSARGKSYIYVHGSIPALCRPRAVMPTCPYPHFSSRSPNPPIPP
jgi:hypothetical protein